MFIMVNAEEALTSDDPNIVKRLRGSISTQISCDVKLLEKELAKKKMGHLTLQILAIS